MKEASPGLVIFDCDGVLVDSEPIANRVFLAELTRLGLSLSFREHCETFIGLSMKRCAELIVERLGRPLPDDFFQEMEVKIFDALRDEVQPVRGIGAALDRIDDLGLATCIASSGPHRKIRLTLDHTGLLSRFEGRMFSASEVERSKPFPDLYYHAARSCGFPPDACVVVEDSAPGVQAGVAAGMTVLGYAERNDADRLRAAGARVFHRMDELPELVERSLRTG